MTPRRFWFVSMTVIFVCGCGRQNAQPNSFPAPPAQVDAIPVDNAGGDQRAVEVATDRIHLPAPALAEFRATLGRAFEELRKRALSRSRSLKTVLDVQSPR